ncbi:hypothetical protein I302_102696 [Kwoniella bestiolae CBS 10118]|uniref:Uncharacterized protein n=1 Tax=Kwoniella bestiolae CBS 10118 TaxID=1296100 RepID=A0AAJ8K4I6_9TREE
MPRPRSCNTILATARDLKLVGKTNDSAVRQADLELTCPSETCRQKSLISIIGHKYDGRSGSTMVKITSRAILTCPNASCSKSIGIINPLFKPKVKSSKIYRTLTPSDIKEFDISNIGTKLTEDTARIYYRYHDSPPGTRETVQTTWQPEGQSAEIDIVPTFLGYRISPSQQEYDGVYTYRTDEGYETCSTLRDVSISGLPEKFTYN